MLGRTESTRTGSSLSIKDYAAAIAPVAITIAVSVVIYGAFFAPIEGREERRSLATPQRSIFDGRCRQANEKGESLERRAEQFFSKYDLNRDGAVDRGEYKTIEGN